ncbi:MAG: UDP-N-acetylmuramoyl-tripeptide--D-alanyl-D-alanine ligase, partial [Bacteroidota bacterium]
MVELTQQLNLKGIFAGEEFLKVKENSSATFFQTAAEVSEYLHKNKISDSLILIKASRGMKLEMVVENL